MFGTLGMQELLLLMGLALLIFGPKRLPEIGRTMGRAMGEFRRATTDLKRTLEYEADQEERRSTSKPRPLAAAEQPLAAAPGAAGGGSAAGGADGEAPGAESSGSEPSSSASDEPKVATHPAD